MELYLQAWKVTKEVMTIIDSTVAGWSGSEGHKKDSTVAGWSGSEGHKKDLGLHRKSKTGNWIV
jgi:uncharacterized protein YkwD